MAGNFQNEVASERSRISMNKKMRCVIGPKPWVATKMSLPPQWQKWAIPLVQYGVRFSELGHTGGSNRALPRQKRRHHGDDQADGPASDGNPLAYSAASAARLMSPLWPLAQIQGRPCGGDPLRGDLNDVVEKRKSRVVWYPVERHVNVHPTMAGCAEVLASQGL